MPKRIIRRDLSALGAYLVLYVVISNVIMFFCLFVGGSILYLFSDRSVSLFSYVYGQLTGNSWFLLTINAVALYVIAMPLTAFLIRRRVPSIFVLPELPSYYEEQQADCVTGVQTAGGFYLKDVPALIAIIAFLMAAGSMIGAGLAELLGDAAGIEATNAQVEELLSGDLAATILFVVILGPIAEELFFRKFLTDLMQPVSRRGAVLLSAVTFALIHQNIYQFFYALFLGWLLAVIYTVNGRVWQVILAHIGINFFGGIVLPRITENLLDSDLLIPETGRMPDILGDPVSILIMIVFYLLIVTGAILTLIYAVRGRFRVEEKPHAPSPGDFAAALFTAPGMLFFILVCLGIAAFSLLQLI